MFFIIMNESVWDKVYQYLCGFKASREIYIKSESDCKRFVEAVFWMARSGSQWRLLPKEFGHWYATWKRFSKWADKGIWYKMFYYFQNDPDMEYVMVDSTILRAHACAAVKKKTNQNKD
jgi:transposase